MARTTKTNKEATLKRASNNKQVKKTQEKNTHVRAHQRKAKNKSSFSLKTYWEKFWHGFAGDFGFHSPLDRDKQTEDQKEPLIRFLPFFSILALVLALLGAYTLGRVETSCISNYSSSVGTLKVISVMTPEEDNTSQSIFSFLPSIPSIVKISDLKATKNVILVNTQGDTLTVIHPSSMNLTSFDNKNVILTGQFSPCTKSVTLDTIQNITPLF